MMTTKNLRRYLQYVQEQGSFLVNERLLEKDYLLSLFLSNLHKLAGSEAKRLVFKGGTLLTKNYTAYQRISEDLDFTHQDSNALRAIRSKNQRERRIKATIIRLLDEIKRVSDECNFDFATGRTNKRYVVVHNSRAVYILRVYYRSVIDNQEGMLKVEINFLEQMMHPPVPLRIKNITSYVKTDKAVLRSLGYDLEEAELLCYPIEEIILEKFRALLTRQEMKERDFFNLYLINREHPVLRTRPEEIIRKIKSAELIMPESDKNFKKTCKTIMAGTLTPTENIDLLTIKPYNKVRYGKFRDNIINKLHTICTKEGRA